MSLRLTVLASGSGGNSSLLEVEGFRLLVDAGLGPRQLARRFTAAGATWDRIRAVVLTHTHSDHWKERTLAHLLRLRIPLYCHADHVQDLRLYCAMFADLQGAGLVRLFETGRPFSLAPHLECLPFELQHDIRPTFGFRFDCQPDLFGTATSVAYAADLGTWDGALAATLSDVDILALEFNHDVGLQRASDRPEPLIERVLGDRGHLSNEQAACLLREVLARSAPGRLQHLVQLHLSRQCNRPELAAQAARTVLADLGSKTQVHTAAQDTSTTILFSGILGRSRQDTPGAMPAPSDKRRVDIVRSGHDA